MAIQVKKAAADVTTKALSKAACEKPLKSIGQLREVEEECQTPVSAGKLSQPSDGTSVSANALWNDASFYIWCGYAADAPFTTALARSNSVVNASQSVPAWNATIAMTLPAREYWRPTHECIVRHATGTADRSHCPQSPPNTMVNSHNNGVRNPLLAHTIADCECQDDTAVWR